MVAWLPALVVTDGVEVAGAAGRAGGGSGCQAAVAG
jgi:hypothetical protein